ncbi:MAG TPA: hypothetical protein VII36_07825 [Usitatibacter sp.]
MRLSSILASVSLLALLALLSATASAESLYAVSMRTYSDPGYKGVEGNLYVVSTETGASRLLSTLTVGGGKPVGLDGLAIHPKTGRFYGITAPTSAAIPRSLVTIDPKTGVVTVVGDLCHTGTDIEFDSEGTLYVWLPDTRQLGTANLDTGEVTPRGPALERGALKGSLALLGGGRALVAATGGKGTIDTMDIATGVITPGPALTGAPFPDLINGLAFSSRGVLYGNNSNGGQPTLANLVMVDPRTGQVTNVGPLPNDTDALAFGPEISDVRDMSAGVMEWRMPLLIVLFLLAVVVLIVAMRAKPPKG